MERTFEGGIKAGDLGVWHLVDVQRIAQGRGCGHEHNAQRLGDADGADDGDWGLALVGAERGEQPEDAEEVVSMQVCDQDRLHGGELARPRPHDLVLRGLAAVEDDGRARGEGQQGGTDVAAAGARDGCGVQGRTVRNETESGVER